jgi:hypothetical protein
MSMPRVGIESKTPAIEREKAGHDLDPVAAVIGIKQSIQPILKCGRHVEILRNDTDTPT